MARFDFWTHGVNTIVQSTAPGQVVEHTGVGTMLSQNANTQAWCHIPIPTPTVLDGDLSITLGYIRLRADLNENAEIDQVQLLVDGSSIWTASNLSISNTTVDQRFNNPNFQVGGGLVISVLVKFLSGGPKGKITFKGAGARFEQFPVVLETLP
jgi:Family of unknown function (DUF6623)